MIVDKERILSFVERVERLEAEKKEVSQDIREVFSEAKGAGFDKKVLKALIKLRKMNPSDREEYEFLYDNYRSALDM